MTPSATPATTPTTADPFGPNFQRLLIRASLEDPGLRALIERFFDRGELRFTDGAAAWAWAHISQDPYPTLLMLSHRARSVSRDDPNVLAIDAMVHGPSDFRETEFLRREIVEWCRRQTFRLGFNAAAELFKRGEINDAERVMMQHIEQMNRIRLEPVGRSWFFEQLDDRMARRLDFAEGTDYVPTGIDPIDRHMQGGLRRGELMTVMAHSGVGKTFFAAQLGFFAARMRFRVAHFLLEGATAKIEDRYESRWAATLYRHVRRGDITAEAMRSIRDEYLLMGKNLLIRKMEADMKGAARFDDVMAELADLRTSLGWVPDLILVDYADLFTNREKTDYARQKLSFQQMRALADRQEFRGHAGYMVMTPTQAQRVEKGAQKKAYVMGEGHVGDCVEKYRISDIFLSLNQTEQEYRDREIRVHMAKYRDDEANITVRTDTNYAQGTFSVFGTEEALTRPQGEV